MGMDYEEARRQLDALLPPMTPQAERMSLATESTLTDAQRQRIIRMAEGSVGMRKQPRRYGIGD